MQYNIDICIGQGGNGGGSRGNRGNNRRGKSGQFTFLSIYLTFSVDRDEGGGRQSAGSGAARGREKAYGIVISLKESFGFILPYSGDEHLYFNERDGKCTM